MVFKVYVVLLTKSLSGVLLLFSEMVYGHVWKEPLLHCTVLIMFELMMPALQFYMMDCIGPANPRLQAGNIINLTGGLSYSSMNFNGVKQHY